MMPDQSVKESCVIGVRVRGIVVGVSSTMASGNG